MKTIETISDALKLPGNTLLEKSVKPFQSFLDEGFKGSPVEFCYNSMSHSADKDGKVTTQPSFIGKYYLCLRFFTGSHTNPTDAAMMKITNKKGRPSFVKKFYDYLMSPDSPWASCHDVFAAVRPDKNGIPDALLWYNNKDKCAKMVMNFLTTARLHTCWGLDYVFVKLVDAGFTPEEAILLSTNFSWAGQTLTVSNGPPGMFDEDVANKLSLSKFGVSKTDMPFLTNHNPSGFKPLFDKKPSYSGGSYAEGNSVQPNSFIWNADGKEVNADHISTKNGNLQVSIKENILSDYLKGGKTPPESYIQEVREKLHKNEKLYI